MKKLLSVILALAIIVTSAFATYLIFANEDTTPTGGYMRVTGRGNQNSGPRQLLGDVLNASGDGTYLLSAWVRLPGNTASKSVAIMVYPGSWPAAILTKTITNGEWTLISGEVTISGTANFANNESIYFRIQTGSALTDNWDIDFDNVVLKKKTGSTYGENLIGDSACELGENTPWYATSATITNPVVPVVLKGVQVEYKSDANLFISKKDQFNFCLDGKKAEVTVYNAGTENILLQLQVRSGSWSTLGGGSTADWVTITPNQKATITTEIAEDKVANDNWAVLVTNGANKTGKIIICDVSSNVATTLADSAKWNVNNSVAPIVVDNPEIVTNPPVTEPPVATPDPNALYGVQVEYSAHAETGFIAKQGILDFVRNGDTATVKIYNPSTTSIKVALQIRKANWSTVAGNNDWHIIGAGEGKTITVQTSAENTFEDNFVVLVAEPGATGKLVLCDIKLQQATTLSEGTKWYTNASPEIIENPEFTEAPAVSPSAPAGTETTPVPAQKPDLTVEEGYITVTNRVNQNAGPRQYVGDVLKQAGDGTYYLSAWVKIPNNTSEKAVRLIVVADGKYPQVAKNVTSGEWTLIAGEISITGTANISKNTDAYFRIQTGNAIDESFDIYFDGITLNKKNADASYGENLFVNADFNKEDPATWANDPNCTVTFVDAKEKIEVVKPTGVIITALEETETNHIVTNTGIVSKEDIKDGKITKTFTILNQGEEPVKVTLSLQCVHKNEEGNDMWSAPVKGFTALIEPGDKQELTYTMEVNADGTITVSGGNNDMDHKPEEFFARFDILEADGNPKVIKGTKLVILNDNENVTFTAGDRTNITVEVTYSKQYATSDMIPFSAIVLVPLTVAFVLVIKKRKEN